MRLRALRKASGLSQEGMAILLKISQSHCSRLEHDQDIPSQQMRIQIAQILGVTDPHLHITESPKESLFIKAYPMLRRLLRQSKLGLFKLIMVLFCANAASEAARVIAIEAGLSLPYILAAKWIAGALVLGLIFHGLKGATSLGAKGKGYMESMSI